MKTDDLDKGNKIQKRIDHINDDIDKLRSIRTMGDSTDREKTYGDEIDCITIGMIGQNHNLLIEEKKLAYTDKTNTFLEILNQLYRDNVLRILEKCKEGLEKEFEMIGKE